MSSASKTELHSVANFQEWLRRKGAYLHPALKFVKDISGMSVFAVEVMSSDCKVVSCPFALAITPCSSKHALLALSKLSNDKHDQLDALTERELVCTYIVVHWLLEEEGELAELQSTSGIATSLFEHLPYLHILPPADELRTPLHFTPEELSLLRGTNMYGATVDRQRERQLEWERCSTYAETLRPAWRDRFTWKRYLTAATYLSSRAFPSTILSPTPSLISIASSHPVLIPGVDSFNHARGHRVSWVVDPVQSNDSLTTPFSPSHDAHQISLIIHNSTPAHTQVFNNYGPKSNSELILGYGFSLPANPDDTIVLKIGGVPGGVGGSGRSWEVGRNARGSEGLWQEMITVFSQGTDDDGEIIEDWETELEAAETLKEMVVQKLKALPHVAETEGVRGDVLRMIWHYVEGQRDILQSLCAFADLKRERAVAKAKQDGVEIDGEAVDPILTA